MPTMAQGVLERAPTHDVAPGVGGRRSARVPLTYSTLAPHADKFHSKIDRTSEPGHWIWTGGYTYRRRAGFWYGRRDVCLAAHASLVLATKRDRPAGTLARHLCEMTDCVHPEHWAWACDEPAAGPEPSGLVRQGGDLDWQNDAACRDAPDPNIFYPDPLPQRASHEQRVAFRKRQEEALSYCARCAVREKCGPYALEVSGGYGIWASMPEKTLATVVEQRTAVRRAVVA